MDQEKLQIRGGDKLGRMVSPRVGWSSGAHLGITQDSCTWTRWALILLGRELHPKIPAGIAAPD